MDAMSEPVDPAIPPSPAPKVEACYRHPSQPTLVHCTRCGRPICPDCMIAAPVGHQCPECVGQAQRAFRQGPGRRSVTRDAPATRVLLAAIVGVFAVELLVGGPRGLMNGPREQGLFDLGALYPPAVAIYGQYWRLLSAMFLHAGLFHILFNGWALWVFGSVVERDYGTPRFLAIYFVSGFLASVTSYAFGPANALAVGASGAIFGIFGAFVVYNFKRRHLALAAQNLRTAMMLLLLNAFLAFTIGTIDWHAHLGGFLAGIACGAVAEGFGSRAQRTLVAVLGYGALIAVGVLLTMWRTAELRSLAGL